MILRSGSSCRRKSVTWIFRQLSSGSGNDDEKNINKDEIDNVRNRVGQNMANQSRGAGGVGGTGGRGEEARGSAISFFRSRREEGSANWIKGVKELLIPKKGNESRGRDKDAERRPSSDEEIFERSAKSFNTRKKFDNNRVAGGSKYNTGYNKFGEDGPSFSKPRSRRTARGEEQDDSSSDNYRSSTVETVPPNVMLQLFDVEALQHKIEDKMGIDLEELDEGDRMLANIVMECLKNEDGVYREVLTSKDLFDNLRIPVARPARSLLMSTIPDINEDPDSIGYKLGSTAWQALSKNYYYTEAECKYMSQSIARITNKILARAEEDFETDLIFHNDFRKGLAGIEHEERKLELLNDQQVVEVFEQGETDWDQDAVVDEDDLFDEDEK